MDSRRAVTSICATCWRGWATTAGSRRSSAAWRRCGLARPAHLAGLGGWDAGWLYRRGRDGDREALRRFAEYNLYDVINLRTLIAYAYNALVERESDERPRVRAATARVPVPGARRRAVRRVEDPAGALAADVAHKKARKAETFRASLRCGVDGT